MKKQELIKHIEDLPYKEGPIVDKIDISRKGLLELVKQLDEPQPVKVPQFVADWYEENKDDFETKLFRFIESLSEPCEEDDLIKFIEWLIDDNTKTIQTLVNMHQFGYEVEKEKRYLVKLKGMNRINGCLANNKKLAAWYFGISGNSKNHRTNHTRKELEEAGFGWVFDCPGVQIEEVKDE